MSTKEQLYIKDQVPIPDQRLEQARENLVELLSEHGDSLLWLHTEAKNLFPEIGITSEFFVTLEPNTREKGTSAFPRQIPKNLRLEVYQREYFPNVTIGLNMRRSGTNFRDTNSVKVIFSRRANVAENPFRVSYPLAVVSPQREVLSQAWGLINNKLTNNMPFSKRQLRQGWQPFDVFFNKDQHCAGYKFPQATILHPDWELKKEEIFIQLNKALLAVIGKTFTENVGWSAKDVNVQLSPAEERFKNHYNFERFQAIVERAKQGNSADINGLLSLPQGFS